MLYHTMTNYLLNNNNKNNGVMRRLHRHVTPVSSNSLKSDMTCI